MKYKLLYTFIFFLAIFLFFGLAYPHHLHYQEQYQLFLFDSTYAWDIIKHPGGISDLLGRFCTQFFLYAWVGAFIIALLLSLVQVLTYRVAPCGNLYGLSFVPSALLWVFLLDENALLGGVWAILIALLAVWGFCKMPKAKLSYIIIAVALPLLYWLTDPLCTHYYRNPKIFPTLLWIAVSVVILLVICHRWVKLPAKPLLMHLSFAVVAICIGIGVWKSANFKAEKVMHYDFMATHQQWNRIIEAINKEKPNNQIGVTVQNLALAMRGQLASGMMQSNQNGISGLLPDVQTDATSPMPTAEAYYQLGMVYAAQRTVFEAQEAILDFQKSARCYKRLAQTNLIIGSYEVSRKYLYALQKTLFYRGWATETLALLDDESAIAKHPEYGRLRKMNYKEDFYFSDRVTSDMLQRLFLSNTTNRLAYDYLMASYLLTGNREDFIKNIGYAEKLGAKEWQYYLK